MCAEQSSMVSICKINLQTGTLVRCGGEFVASLFEWSHREIAEKQKCLSVWKRKMCVLGNVGS